MELKIINSPSPNYGERPSGGKIDTLVIHYTDTETAEAAIEILTDPASAVSAHYVIDIDGAVHALVDEEKRAWHAGVGYWRGNRDLNSHSIGIELQNTGAWFGLTPFPPPQMNALLMLSRRICAHWPIEARNVIGHSDLAPDRKIDPGPYFDWRWLSEHGIGLWPLKAPVSSNNADPMTLLSEIGYDIGAEQAVRAFQLHYRPQRTDNILDPETIDLLIGLHRKIA